MRRATLLLACGLALLATQLGCQSFAYSTPDGQPTAKPLNEAYVIGDHVQIDTGTKDLPFMLVAVHAIDSDGRLQLSGTHHQRYAFVPEGLSSTAKDESTLTATLSGWCIRQSINEDGVISLDDVRELNMTYVVKRP